MRRVVTVFFIVLVGCSGGGGHSSTATTTTTTVPPPPSAADTARAKAALLTAADFPAGWTSTPADTSSTDQSTAELRTCLHLSADSPLFAPPSGSRASSPDFVQGNVSIHNDARVSSTDRITQAFKVLGRSDFTGCVIPVLREVVQAALAKSTVPSSIDSVHVDGLAVASGATQSKAFRTTITVTVSGQKTAIYVDLVYVAVRDLSSSITFQALQTPVDAATEKHYTDLVVSRLR